nr:hypothetical protein [Tanacetum cinerariifolium]
MTDYSLWVIEGVVEPVAPTTAEQRLARKNELKARGTLLMALPDKHQLKFNINKDAKTLMEAIKKRSLPTEWRTHTLILRNKTDLEVQSLDDLFNSLKIYEAETRRNLGENGPTSMGFDMSKGGCYNCHRKGHFTSECWSPKDTRRNGAAEPQRRNVPVETSTSNALVSQCDGLGSCDWSFQADEVPTNYALMAFISSSSSSNNELRDNALVVLRQNLEKAEQERDDLKFKLEKFQTTSKNLSEVLASQTNDKLGLGYNTQVFTHSMFDCDHYLTSKSDDSLPPSPIYDRYQSGDGYHAVPPLYTGTFMPPKPNFVFHNAPNAVETKHTAFNVGLSPNKPNNDLSHTHRPSTPIIEDWISDSENESKTKLPNVPSFVQPTEQVKSPRLPVQHVETSIPTANPKTAILKPTSNGNHRNKKACFIQRISLTGFPAQIVGSSNTKVLDSPCLLVLITGTSQSRQHGSDDGVTISFQLSRNSRPSMLDHQDKYMMKAQVQVSKSFAISDVQPLPRRKHHCQIYQMTMGGNDDEADHQDPDALDNTRPEAKSRYNTKLAHLLPRHVCSLCVVNWETLNRMGYGKEIDGMLRINLFKAGTNEEMLTYVRTTRYDKIQENDLWLSSMFDARHQNGYANVAWLIARKARMLSDDVLTSLSALIYCRDLDTTTLRKLIDYEGRLIHEALRPDIPRVAIPRPLRVSMQDLYERMVA